MEFKETTLRILKAAEGHKLTQSADDTELGARITTAIVYLAVGDKAENWKEITDAEAEEIRQAQADKAEADRIKFEKESRLRELQAELDKLQSGDE